MHRRDFIKGVSAATIATPVMARNDDHRVDIDNVQFQWRHSGSRLFGQLNAPTTGWIAVGFNNQERLKGSRFVIAVATQTGGTVEEHIALVPDHVPVSTLGLLSGLQDVSVVRQSEGTVLQFSLPHHFTDTDNPDLSPGQDTYLMLAWSQAPEFDHHSAWRKHLVVNL